MRMLPGTGALTFYQQVRRRLHPASGGAAWGPLPDDLARFAAIPASRSEASRHRVLHVGPLSPDSGAADLLVALASWAERNPAVPVAIEWVGRGDLAGVLAAQPLPPNLRQRFAGELDRPSIATALAAASIMVVPPRATAPVLEALAAGAVLVGERRDPAMRGLVGPEGPAWGYHAWGQPALSDALGAALDASPAELSDRRRIGRRLALGDDAPREAAGPLISGTVLL